MERTFPRRRLCERIVGGGAWRGRLLGWALLVICAGSAWGQPEAAGQGAFSTKSRAEEKAAIQRILLIPEKAGGLIRLPLRVIIARDWTLTRKEQAMGAWIQTQEIGQVVLPEVNRIWKPAQIEWVVEAVVEDHLRPQDAAAHQAASETIVNGQRDATGRPDFEQVPLLRSFYEPKLQHPAIQNLYLFPFLGSTLQGVAKNGGNYAFAGLWTDKPSKGTRPPERVLLAEPEPFKIGSLGRTCAHELGHNLRLNHPDKKDPNVDLSVGRLMGGLRQGYTLTPEEIATARATALVRAREIQAWLQAR